MNKRIKSTAILATVAMSATSVSVLADEVKTTENIDNVNVTTVTTTTKVEVTETELNEAKSAVSQAEAALKDANKSVQEIEAEIAKIDIPAQEAAVAETTATYNTENQKLEELKEKQSTIEAESKVLQEKVVKNEDDSKKAQEDIDSLTTKKTNAEEIISKKTAAEKELNNINDELSKVKAPYNVEAEFTLSPEYLSALKERVAFYMNREPWQGEQNTNVQANNANNELLLSLSEKLKVENLQNETNLATWSDTTKIENINELTVEQKQEINLYAINIINKIRNQVLAEVKTDTLPIVQNRPITTADLSKFGQVIDGKILRVTVGNETRDLDIVGVKGDKTLINETVEVPLQTTQASSLLIKKINEVYGIDLDTNVDVAGLKEVKLTQGMLNFADEVASRIEKNPTQEVFSNQMFSYPSNIINEAAANNGLRTATSGQHQDELKYFEDAITSPSMTMGQLKKYIYQAFTRYMFEPDFNDSKKDRIWEKAGAVAGLVGKRRDQDLAAVSLVLAKDPWKTAEYKLTVHSFFEADNTYGITNPEKFDKTVITNGTPDEAKKYSELIKRKNQISPNINTLTKQLNELGLVGTVSEIDAKISELNTTKSEADKSIKNLQAEIAANNKKVESLAAQITTQAEVVRNAKADLESAKTSLAALESAIATLDLPAAKQKVEEATTRYNTAKSKLEQLVSGVKTTSESTGLPDSSQTHSLPEAKIELKEVAFETVYENDPTLELGKDVVVREGQNGSVQIITIGDQVTEIVLTEKVDKLVKRGTLVKEEVKPEVQPEVKPEVKPAVNSLGYAPSGSSVSNNTAKTLPQTGEDTSFASVLGVSLLSSALFIAKRRRKA
ncbi:TPA: LPXTG cell wall anchor domain-containing protein [Streptococcus suis]